MIVFASVAKVFANYAVAWAWIERARDEGILIDGLVIHPLQYSLTQEADMETVTVQIDYDLKGCEARRYAEQADEPEDESEPAGAPPKVQG